MKSITFPLFFAFSIFLISPVFSQDEAWERIIPKPQEHDLLTLSQIPGTSTIVAGGAGATIMFSNDNGENWDVVLNPAGLPNSEIFTSVIFADEYTGYAVTYKGSVIKTVDGGHEWTKLLTVNGTYVNEYLADIHCFDADTVIVASDNWVLRTTNGGNIWDTLVSGESTQHYAIEFIDKDTGFIVGSTSTILKTTDKGVSWSWFKPDYPINMNYSDIKFVNDSVGFLAGSLGYPSDTVYILKTTNSGLDWELVFKTTLAFSIGEIEFKDEMQGCVRMYTWWSDSFVYTEDGGSTWSWCEDFYWSSYYRDDTFLYTQEYLIGAGRFGKLAKTETSLGPWDAISYNWNAGDFLDVEFTSGQTGYAMYRTKGGGLPSGRIYKTSNGGQTWTGTTVQGTEFGALSFINDQFGYAVDYHGPYGIILYKTVDGAETWQEINDFNYLDIYPDMPYHLEFIDSLNGFVTLATAALKTSNGGVTWQEVLTLQEDWWDEGFTSISYVSPDTIFLSRILFPATIYKSFDGGETFESQLLGYEGGMVRKVYFTDNTTGFVLVNYADQNGSKILKTVDGGENWYETQLNFPAHLVFDDIIFPEENIGYAIGHKDFTFMFKSMDGGENWDTINIECSSQLRELVFFDDWHGLVFGDKGVILETFSGGVVGLEENPFVANKSNISVFPNPAQDKITIQLEDGVTNDIYLELYNLQGKCLVRKYYPNTSPKQNINLDISKLPPGIYTCRVKNGNLKSTSKVVKL